MLEVIMNKKISSLFLSVSFLFSQVAFCVGGQEKAVAAPKATVAPKLSEKEQANLFLLTLLNDIDQKQKEQKLIANAAQDLLQDPGVKLSQKKIDILRKFAKTNSKNSENRFAKWYKVCMRSVNTVYNFVTPYAADALKVTALVFTTKKLINQGPSVARYLCTEKDGIGNKIDVCFGFIRSIAQEVLRGSSGPV